jgi:hypothetical protein
MRQDAEAAHGGGCLGAGSGVACTDDYMVAVLFGEAGGNGEPDAGITAGDEGDG